ncbi:uncharacterized protein [Clytia hemisphaerica]|uniref:ADF-H domain-containing protein n=1 Tax=Clytia hemisphaerica TaxID=252671 RepID=A0A7M5U802_9CNID|eukprot:TCONS_00026903-protein
MPISGIKCDKEVVDSLLELRDHRKHRFIFYKIRRNGKGVSVNFCRKGKRDATFADFLREVPKEEPRYIIYDFTYMTKEWEKRDRILFIFWSPDRARCEDKVQYTSTKSAILKEVQKVFAMKHIEVTDFNELKENDLIEYGQPLRERENSLVGVEAITINC